MLRWMIDHPENGIYSQEFRLPDDEPVDRQFA
jgi:hypothetical protein